MKTERQWAAEESYSAVWGLLDRLLVTRIDEWVDYNDYGALNRYSKLVESHVASISEDPL